MLKKRPSLGGNCCQTSRPNTHDALPCTRCRFEVAFYGAGPVESWARGCYGLPLESHMWFVACMPVNCSSIAACPPFTRRRRTRFVGRSRGFSCEDGLWPHPREVGLEMEAVSDWEVCILVGKEAHRAGFTKKTEMLTFAYKRVWGMLRWFLTKYPP